MLTIKIGLVVYEQQKRDNFNRTMRYRISLDEIFDIGSYAGEPVS